MTPLSSGRFFGNVRVREEHAGYALTHLRHDRAVRLPVHSHERAYFSLVRRGGYAETFGRSHLTYGAGAVMFHPPGIVHQDEVAPGGASFLIVEIGDEMFRRACDDVIPHRSVQDRRGGELAHAAWRLERECSARERSPLVVEGIVLEMLGILGRMRDEHEDPAWLSSVLDRLHSEIDQPLTIQSLAHDAGVTPTRLSRAFRRRFGTGVGEYLRTLRVRWVEQRLGDPDVGLAELAVAAGFVDQSHMTRAFRQVLGRTPGALRRARD